MEGDYDSPYEKMKRERGKIKYIPMGDESKHTTTTTTPTLQSKHGGNEKQPLFAIPLPRRRRRRFGSNEAEEEDYNDFTNYLGYRPGSVTLVDSREVSPPQ